MSVHGGFQKTGGRHRHGRGHHFRVDPGLGFELPDQPLSARPRTVLPHHAVVHRGDRRYRAIHRNGGAENQSGVVSSVGYLSAADHHQTPTAGGSAALILWEKTNNNK